MENKCSHAGCNRFTYNILHLHTEIVESTTTMGPLSTSISSTRKNFCAIDSMQRVRCRIKFSSSYQAWCTVPFVKIGALSHIVLRTTFFHLSHLLFSFRDFFTIFFIILKQSSGCSRNSYMLFFFSIFSSYNTIPYPISIVCFLRFYFSSDLFFSFT